MASNTKERFYSLDVFRGMTVALMILVNNPGTWDAIYTPLEHAKWNGCTAADLVFPFFLFAVGNAMAFVIPAMEKAGTAFFLRKILKRFCIIFLIGLTLNWLPFFKWEDDHLIFMKWENVRIMGVLQRIAIANLFAALLIYFLKIRWAAIISVLILIIYSGITIYFHAHIPENRFGAAVDAAILGESHMYKGLGYAFDPEGLVTGITPIVQIVFGYVAGWYIRKMGKNMRMISGLWIAGIAAMVLGYAWNLFSPMSKNIWSSSYVVFTTGFAMVIIGLLVYLIEILGIKGFLAKFFDTFGKNPLFIFVLSGFLPRVLRLFRIEGGIEDGKMKYYTPFEALYHHFIQPLFVDERNASLLYAVLFILFMWAIAWWMDKKKIYVKV